MSFFNMVFSIGVINSLYGNIIAHVFIHSQILRSYSVPGPVIEAGDRWGTRQNLPSWGFCSVEVIANKPLYD